MIIFRKILLFAIVWTGFTFLAYAQNQFFKAISGTLTEVTVSDPSGLSDILRWQCNNGKASIKMNIQLSSNLPTLLDATQTPIDFSEALATWMNTASCFATENTTTYPYSFVCFTANKAVFGSVYDKAGGVMFMAAEGNSIVCASAASATEYSATQIYFNNTTEFNNKYKWTNNQVLPNDGVDYFIFKTTALHEIGHLLGLSHNYLNSNTVMAPKQSPREARFSLSNDDVASISTMNSVIKPAINATTDGNGTILPSGSFSDCAGYNQSFTITPNTNYSISDVLVDGISVGAVASYLFTNVTSNHTISASFTIDNYTITASAGANGSITPSGTINVSPGGNQNFSITPNTGYRIADVLVDGTSVGAVASYQFTSVTSNHTIAASFTMDTYTITASAGTGGSISPPGGCSGKCWSQPEFSDKYGCWI